MKEWSDAHQSPEGGTAQETVDRAALDAHVHAEVGEDCDRGIQVAVPANVRKHELVFRRRGLGLARLLEGVKLLIQGAAGPLRQQKAPLAHFQAHGSLCVAPKGHVEHQLPNATAQVIKDIAWPQVQSTVQGLHALVGDLAILQVPRIDVLIGDVGTKARVVLCENLLQARNRVCVAGSMSRLHLRHGTNSRLPGVSHAGHGHAYI
mmetsp:Transcript_33976/g.81532  ORF Transcript_33976/g.81532 Transcript_33976/m.81532 type:complete len:206 (-) Transcript_33976:15-632(-)